MKLTFRSRLGMLAVAASVAGAACDTIPVGTVTPSTTKDIFFTSQLMARGSTTRSFTVAKAGEAKVLFTSLLPDTDGVINIDLGTWNGTTCSTTTTVATKAGSTDPVITATLAVGDYCLRLADPGVLTKTNDFSMTITIPAG